MIICYRTGQRKYTKYSTVLLSTSLWLQGHERLLTSPNPMKVYPRKPLRVSANLVLFLVGADAADVIFLSDGVDVIQAPPLYSASFRSSGSRLVPED